MVLIGSIEQKNPNNISLPLFCVGFFFYLSVSQLVWCGWQFIRYALAACKLLVRFSASFCGALHCYHVFCASHGIDFVHCDSASHEMERNARTLTDFNRLKWKQENPQTKRQPHTTLRTARCTGGQENEQRFKSTMLAHFVHDSFCCMFSIEFLVTQITTNSNEHSIHKTRLLQFRLHGQHTHTHGQKERMRRGPHY